MNKQMQTQDFKVLEVAQAEFLRIKSHALVRQLHKHNKSVWPEICFITQW